jgi:YhcH/YjgK/YiaL family protein
MIIDSLENAEGYYDRHPAFAEAFAFLKHSNIAELPVADYPLNGDHLFCSISNGPGRTRAEAILEAHRRYIDIQYVIAGPEEMGWRRTGDCQKVHTPYDSERDVCFFEDTPDRWTVIESGFFVIFLPEDAHAPLVGQGSIHKAVVKVAVE